MAQWHSDEHDAAQLCPITDSMVLIFRLAQLERETGPAYEAHGVHLVRRVPRFEAVSSGRGRLWEAVGRHLLARDRSGGQTSIACGRNPLSCVTVGPGFDCSLEKPYAQSIEVGTIVIR